MPPPSADCHAFGYVADDRWAKLPPGYRWPEVAGVATDSRDNVFVFNRGDHPVIVFAPDGTFLRAWGEGVFVRPHGITIGPDDSVYCCDDSDHTVKKFTPDGRLLMTLGTSGQPSDTGATSVDYRTVKRAAGPFNYPTNLAFSPSGDFYVSDGYGNARVHRFSADGRLLSSWGEPGDGPGQFNLPHGIAFDDGIVYVADRENSRVQLFDADGKYLAQWTDVARPCQVFVAGGLVYVAELGFRAGVWPGTAHPPGATGGRLSIFDKRGELRARWGGGDDPCAAGDFFAPHDVRVDSRGAIYVAEVVWSAGASKGLVSPDCHALQKFTRRAEGAVMKAWRFHAFDDLRLDDVPEPVCRPNHVIVQPLVVQPSVTEAQLAKGIPTLAYDRIKRRLETEAPVQLFGHEFCARIVEVGEGVTRFAVGERVAARAKLPCGDCPLCREQRADLCRAGPVVGFDLPGCFAELAILPAISLVKVDDRISDSEAACLQSLSDSVAAVETAGIRIGDSVAIFGQGSMGLECLQVARNCGAGLIVTVDVREESCRTSAELGADHVIDANQVDPVEAIRELTGGNGADVVFECAGGSPKQGLAGTRTLRQAIEATRSGGKLVGVSWFGAPLELDVDRLRERSLRYLFPDISTLGHLQYTVRLMATGRVRVKPTITHVLPGLGRVPEAFEITANKGKYRAVNPAQVVIAT